MAALAAPEPGIADFVLMANVDEPAVVDNLKARYLNDRFYTRIGDIVISVNPYKKLQIYTAKYVEAYRGKNLFEIPPHIFTCADTAFRNMRDRTRDQCVIISGESGAGKTEAAKYLMRYIAAVSGNTERVERIKEQLLVSNPVLEAFGNAKTGRNDNSSRFGKYMDLQFDYKMDPAGGRITTYLLEKSRVVKCEDGERSFHIFYQLLRDTLAEYHYLAQSSTNVVDGVDDKVAFEEVVKSLTTLGIAPETQHSFFEGVAAVLHIGNVRFVKNEEDVANGGKSAKVENMDAVQKASQVLGISPESLEKALVTRSVVDNFKKTTISVFLDVEKAKYTRDALAKAIYGRLFNYVVAQVNERIKASSKTTMSSASDQHLLIGVLDIYGFEIMRKNGFEQFAINYCNERLHQLFIELTLKSEQEEYTKEGIEWIHIEYSNNKPICNLVDAKPGGILAVLDDECLRPGDITDATFLAKLNQQVLKHPNFDSREKTKSIEHDVFRIKHYAGNVDYAIEGFIDKNNDMLTRDLLHCIHASTKGAFRDMFPESAKDGVLRRPETLGTQFKASMHSLVDNLLKKEPHYIRCIKPNTNKQPGVFDAALVLHQCRYLGLLENIKVRRAGYCYRQKNEVFIQRYKMLSKQTWPKWCGSAADGVKHILAAIKGPIPHEHAFGKTKVFLKSPLTLFMLEAERNKIKHKLATKIRARWLAHKWSTAYQRQRAALIKLQAYIKRCVYRRIFLRKRDRAITIQKTFRMSAARGRFRRQVAALHIQRNFRRYSAVKRYKALKKRQLKYVVPLIQRAYRRYAVRKMFVKFRDAGLAAGDRNWRRIQFPSKPKLRECSRVYDVLKAVYIRKGARKYRKSLTPERKAQLQWKVVAEYLLQKKATYPQSVRVPFTALNVSLLESDVKVKAKWDKLSGAAQPIFSFQCVKVHRHSPQEQAPRVVVLTSNKLFVLEEKSLALKEVLDIGHITQITVSPFCDGVLVLQCPEHNRGDVILRSEEHVFAFVSRLYQVLQTLRPRPTSVVISDSVVFSVDKKKTNKIQFQLANDENLTDIAVKPEKEQVLLSVPAKAIVKTAHV